jgi:hypothetical protein
MRRINNMKLTKIIPLILSLVILAALSGCGGSEGSLAEYLGWTSFGGTWRGDLHLTDGREPALVMTFTNYDGDSFHVVAEESIGLGYERREADGEYFEKTKFFKYELDLFLGGECWVNGQIFDEAGVYVIRGNVEIHNGPSVVYGYYDILYTP